MATTQLHDRAPHDITQGAPGEYNTAASLSKHPDWLEVCNRLGYSPEEWRQYNRTPPPVKHETVQIFARGRYLGVSRERVAVYAEYEAEMSRLEALLKYDRERVLRALGLELCDCCGGYHSYG